jgi:hypothetical protein
MSKRVLILFAVGVLLLVGSLFLLKYELGTEPEPLKEAEPEPEIKDNGKGSEVNATE